MADRVATGTSAGPSRVLTAAPAVGQVSRPAHPSPRSSQRDHTRPAHPSPRGSLPRRTPTNRTRTAAHRPRITPGGLPLLLGLAIMATAPALPDLLAEGKIMRPVDGAALQGTEVDIVATAPDGKLELDGKAVPTQEPFNDVFHAVVQAAPGRHTLALVWAGRREEVQFFVGEGAPAEFKPFFQHPPLADVACTQCHGVSRRGRFRFKGGCFACHEEAAFTTAHEHPVHQLQECGMCHNAHGETSKAMLTMPKEIFCKQCHN